MCEILTSTWLHITERRIIEGLCICSHSASEETLKSLGYVDRGQRGYPLREVEWVKNKEKPTIRWRDDDGEVTKIDIMDWFMQKWPTRMEYVKWCVLHCDINIKEAFGRTPLHSAAVNGDKESAKLLLTHKANVNAKDIVGYTPLHVAAANGHKDVVELLLANKVDVNTKANDGRTPLHCATGAGHKDIVKLLKQHGGVE